MEDLSRTDSLPGGPNMGYVYAADLCVFAVILSNGVAVTGLGRAAWRCCSKLAWVELRHAIADYETQSSSFLCGLGSSGKSPHLQVTHSTRMM